MRLAGSGANSADDSVMGNAIRGEAPKILVSDHRGPATTVIRLLSVPKLRRSSSVGALYNSRMQSGEKPARGSRPAKRPEPSQPSSFEATRPVKRIQTLPEGHCPFYKKVEEGAFPGLGYDPSHICGSDPGDIVEPAETYRNQYCLTGEHRDCARFIGSLTASGRAMPAGPYSSGTPPLVRIFGNPIALLGLAVIGVIVGVLGSTLANSTAPPADPGGGGPVRNSTAPLVKVTPPPAAALAVAAAPVTAEPTAPASGPRQAQVSATAGDGVAIRAAPGADGAYLGTAPEGANVMIFEEREVDGLIWYRVQHEGLSGWSASTFVQLD